MSANDHRPAENPNETLAKVETALHLAADKRIREGKADAARSPKAAREAKRSAHPDG